MAIFARVTRTNLAVAYMRQLATVSDLGMPRRACARDTHGVFRGTERGGNGDLVEIRAARLSLEEVEDGLGGVDG